MEHDFKKMNFKEKMKHICSITVKNDGRALDIIFVLCLICIIALCVFLYRSSTHFYDHMEETMQNNINLNIEAMQNEYMDRIHSLLNQANPNPNIVSNHLE